MSRQKVLLLGATGETGGSILTGLLEHGNFEVSALIRPASAEKPATKELAAKGVKIVICDISIPIDELVPFLEGVDVFISAIDGGSQLAQMNLVTAAKKARVKRFVPCNFASICPPGGVMQLRDDKEEVNSYIRKLFVPYTIIDVGYWYQLSFPALPSGRIDYATFPGMTVPLHGDGEAPNLLIDLRDIGTFVARIIDDERTLNRSVYAWGEILTEKDIYTTLEKVSGEKLEWKYVTDEEVEANVKKALEFLAVQPEDPYAKIMVYKNQYEYSKYVRKDNTPEYAKYLGYLDARELYPDIKPKTFREFVGDLLEKRVDRPYTKGLA